MTNTFVLLQKTDNQGNISFCSAEVDLYNCLNKTNALDYRCSEQ